MQALKEMIPATGIPATTGEVYMEGGHICIKASIAEKIFGPDSMALCIYYPNDRTFMAAPAGDDLFRTIHKGKPQILKSKNKAGDRSISIQELLLDNDIDDTNRSLDFVAEEALNILKVIL
jgi:hypothetical protein